MAISREDFFDAKSKGALWDVGVSIKRGNPLPLDADSIFDSLESAQAYAQGVLSYPGQVLAVVAEDETTIYYLDNECQLVEVGGKVAVDGKSIVIDAESGIVSIKDVDSAQTGAVLTKKADGSVEWVKPDTTTVEGLAQEVEALDGRVETLETTVGNASAGLVKQVNDLSTNLSNNYYNKSQVDGLVSGAFHFRGDAEKFEDGNIYVDGEILSTMKPGDVYQVGDKEYAYTGTEWVELGFTVDLSNYATQSWTTAQIGAAKTELQGYADQAESDALTAAKAYTDEKVAPLATSASVTSAIDAAKTELKSYADQAESDAVSTAGTQADSKISAKVGDLGESSTVVQYVDAKDTALDNKITALSGKIDGLGDLAALDEVTESNLNAALKAKIDGKADKATTLAGYGISDAYTKTEVDSAISTAKGEAISAAATATDSKIANKVGEIGSVTVKEYVDGKETTLTGKITTIESTIGGYGDIVSHDASEFEAAGAASAVLGTASDASTANTVYGAKKGVEEAKVAASAAQSSADAKVASVTAGDNSVTIGGTGTVPTVAVKVDPVENNALKLTESGLKVELGAAPEYVIEKEAAPTAGYFASYVLKKNGVQAGAKIDIPKDYLVKSASIKESTGEEDPSGLPAGTKYIDFVINSKDAGGSESHLYLNVNELVDAYTAGNGVEISGSNVISAKVVTGNGLSVDGTGIKIALASGDTAGAMSIAQYSKLEGIEDEAQANVIESITVNGEALEVTGKAVGLPLAAADKLGLAKVDNVSLQAADGVVSVKAVNINLLTQDEDDVLVLDCGASI